MARWHLRGHRVALDPGGVPAPRDHHPHPVPLRRPGRAARLPHGRVIRLKATDVDAFIEASRIEPGTLEHLYPDTSPPSAERPQPSTTSLMASRAARRRSPAGRRRRAPSPRRCPTVRSSPPRRRRPVGGHEQHAGSLGGQLGRAPRRRRSSVVTTRSPTATSAAAPAQRPVTAAQRRAAPRPRTACAGRRSRRRSPRWRRGDAGRPRAGRRPARAARPGRAARRRRWRRPRPAACSQRSRDRGPSAGRRPGPRPPTASSRWVEARRAGRRSGRSSARRTSRPWPPPDRRATSTAGAPAGGPGSLAPVVSSTQVKISVPSNHLMPLLLGERDELLRADRGGLPRRRRSTCGATRSPSTATTTVERVGPPARGPRRARRAGPAARRRHRAAQRRHGAADERPAEVLTTEVLRPARGRPVRPKSSGQKRYVDAIRENVITFGVGPAGTGKSWLAVAMAVQALQAKEVDRIILTRPAVEAGERLGFLPGDLMAKVDPYLRPLYDALHDMVGTRERRQAPRAGRRRGGAAGLHARPHAQLQLHHPRRGAEHHARADEDVPHPHRVRVEGGRHRRHHPGRRRRRAQRPRRASSRSSRGIDGLGWVHLTSGDVVRHRIVQDIVDAYERAHAAAEPTMMPDDPDGPDRPDPHDLPEGVEPDDLPRLPMTPRKRRPPAEGDVEVFGVDEQTDEPVELARWVDLATNVLRRRRRARRGRAVAVFVDEEVMAELNQRFMGADGPTDVLAFPLDDPIDSGRWPDSGSTGPDREPPEIGELPCCSATSWSARRWPPARRPSTPAATTTRSPCSSCTACCTCSAWTTPSPRRPR